MYYNIFSYNQMLFSDDLLWLSSLKLAYTANFDIIWKMLCLHWKHKFTFVLESFRNHYKTLYHIKNIVFMLGCFHAFMNLLTFLAIGMLTEETGLRIIIEVVYVENTFQHMLNRNSLHTFRGHLLIDICLIHLIVPDLQANNLCH